MRDKKPAVAALATLGVGVAPPPSSYSGIYTVTVNY
jgi:hypothetical protein